MIKDEIISIEKIEIGKTIDIEVDGNHLFFANDILTHNSSSDIGLEDTSECIFVEEQITLVDGTVKNIGDVEVGDQITSNDDYKTVMKIHHKKIKDCVKITLKSGKTIVVSKNHIFPSNRGRICINDGLSVGDKLHTK